ncbi:MAG: superoxide dismutase family protein [Kofleriaceae bacterium]|nr:superoxide dismutase family protein [Kofleriaceae bacterium]MCB9574455.1 superoxide dismutase family protein [Kofleriaceae bacterium]
MKSSVWVASLFIVAGCGGASHKKTSSEPAPPPVAEEPEEEEEAEPPPPPPPPPPQQWHARAALTPVKGSKMKAAVVRFDQTEGEGVQIASEGPLAGLKAGTYHVVIHEGAECGKNAAKVGPAWAEAAAAVLTVTATKAEPGALEAGDVELMLDGETSIIGHTLVVHADKKGKVGAAEACGVIEPIADDDGDADAGGDDDDGDE